MNLNIKAAVKRYKKLSLKVNIGKRYRFRRGDVSRVFGLKFNKNVTV